MLSLILKKQALKREMEMGFVAKWLEVHITIKAILLYVDYTAGNDVVNHENFTCNSDLLVYNRPIFFSRVSKYTMVGVGPLWLQSISDIKIIPPLSLIFKFPRFHFVSCFQLIIKRCTDSSNVYIMNEYDMKMLYFYTRME